jgi:predicted nucleic-acid-binding Zn-ribbon protein
MNQDPIEVLLVIPVIVLLVVFIDYLKNHCPKCRAWHFFRFGLIILDKPCEKRGREWVKCKKCGHEWEKLVKGDDVGMGGGE